MFGFDVAFHGVVFQIRARRQNFITRRLIAFKRKFVKVFIVGFLYYGTAVFEYTAVNFKESRMGKALFFVTLFGKRV